MGLDKITPNYIVLEETMMKDLRLEVIKRAIKYEEKARRSDKKLVVECSGSGERKKCKWDKKEEK